MENNGDNLANWWGAFRKRGVRKSVSRWSKGIYNGADHHEYSGEKRSAKAQEQGLVNFYKPTTSRDQAVKSELSQSVARMFKGSIPAFANFLISSENITLNEIEKIKSLLDEKEAELKGR